MSNSWTLVCLAARHWDLNFYHGKDGNARCATPKRSRRFASHYSTITRPQSFYIFYIWDYTPDPVPKADIKNKKFCGIYAVILSKGNLRNLSCVQRAPSEPVSVCSVVKNPASNSHFKKHPLSAAYFDALQSSK